MVSNFKSFPRIYRFIIFYITLNRLRTQISHYPKRLLTHFARTIERYIRDSYVVNAGRDFWTAPEKSRGFSRVLEVIETLSFPEKNEYSKMSATCRGRGPSPGCKIRERVFTLTCINKTRHRVRARAREYRSSSTFAAVSGIWCCPEDNRPMQIRVDVLYAREREIKKSDS